MRAPYRGAVANVLSLVTGFGLPPGQGEPVFAQTEQCSNNLFGDLFHPSAGFYQLENSYRAADPTSIAKLKDQVRALRSCAVATYWEAEDTP